MMAFSILDKPAASRQRQRRRRFGLDAPLPADPATVERAILRHIATARREVLPFLIGPPLPDKHAVDPRASAAGAPTILLLVPGGRAAWLSIRPQAHRPTKAEKAFADLSSRQGAPVHVVRSLPEAIAALDRILGKGKLHA